MKKFSAFLALAISCALTPFSAYAQSVTPNAGLQVPTYQQSNWQVPVIYDLNRLDNVFGGSVSIPSITLSGPITNANQAATKAYVDATAVGFLSASGATMTGPLVLAADPTAPLGAATKQYVDNSISALNLSNTLSATSIDNALGFAPVSPSALSSAITASQTSTPSYTTVTLSGAITNSTQAATKAYVDAAISGVSSSAFTGGTLTQPLILAANPTANLGAATKQYVDNAVVGFLPLTGGTLQNGASLTLGDGSPAASENYVASAVSGLTGGGGTTTTNQQLDQKTTSASTWNKICTATGISGTTACSGVQGTPISVTVATKQSSPVLNTVGVTGAVATYGLTVNSSTNTQILVPTTVGTNYAATIFKREMWFTVGSNLSGVDNWETDTYMFDEPDQWEYMMGWQCRRNAASPNTGSDFWQYDNFRNGWTNTAVPCSIISGHVYHYILMMHRDLASSTSCSGKGGTSDSSITAGPCEYWDTFQLDDLTADTSNTYTLNAKLVAEPASLGSWQTWTGIGSQIQLDVVDSSTGGANTLVSMTADDDTLTTYVPVTSAGGGSTSVTETTGNLGEYDFDGSTPTSGLTATGTPTIDTTNAYSGPNAALFNAASEYFTAPVTSSSQIFARFELNLQTLGTGNLRLLELDNGSTQVANIYLDATSHYVTVSDSPSSTQTVCQATAFSTGAWHRVELAWVEGASTGSYQVLIDGVQTCSVTATNTGTSPVTQVKFGEGGSVTGAYTFDLDNVGLSSVGLLGAVTINSSASTPLYDLYGAAAAAQASSLQVANNLSDLTNPGAALANLLGNPAAGNYIIDCTSGTSCVAQAGTGGSGSMIYPSAGVAVSTGSAWGASVTLATVATSGSYNDLSNKPTIPAAQVNSDWNASSGLAQILNKPTLATVATSGSYTDLTNKPTIPSAISLTTTGSGAASLSGSVLNIPTYVGVASINGTTGAFTFTGSGVSCSGTTCTFTSSGGSMVYPSGSGIPVVSGGDAWGTTVAAPSGTIVGTTDTQTLTNKTLDGVTPTTLGYLDATSSIQTQLNGKQASLGFTAVANTVTVNGHSLSANVTISASDLTTGTLPHGQLPTLLSTDIPSLSAYDPSGAAASAQSAAEAASDSSGSAATAQSNAETYSSNASNISSGTLNHARLPSLVSTDIPNNAANTSGSAGSLSAASALPSGTTATTQTAGDNSTKVATTAYVATAVAPIYINNGVALPTSAIAANTCTAASGSPFTATGVATTNLAMFGWAGDPTGVTGYGSTGGLSVRIIPGSGTVAVKVCNPNSTSITPGAMSINVRVYQ